VLSIFFCLPYFHFLDKVCICLGCVRLVSRNLSCSRRKKMCQINCGSTVGVELAPCETASSEVQFVLLF
jgi:hypothetical protein